MLTPSQVARNARMKAGRVGTKSSNTLKARRAYMESRRAENRRTNVDGLKKILKPRKRTNNKTFTAKSGAPVQSKTGKGTFGPAPSEGGGSSIASPLTETARTVTAHSDDDHDYYVAVESTFTDANNAEVVINWLDPDSEEITII